MKVLLVGESNPYGADPYFALYPAPTGSAGHRLCDRVLAMYRKAYLDTFDRANLVEGPWSIVRARKAAEGLQKTRDKFVLCGSKVSSAFGLEFSPFSIVCKEGKTFAIIPHPSGLCRLWRVEGAFADARHVIVSAFPELAGVVAQ